MHCNRSSSVGTCSRTGHARRLLPPNSICTAHPTKATNSRDPDAANDGTAVARAAKYSCKLYSAWSRSRDHRKRIANSCDANKVQLQVTTESLRRSSQRCATEALRMLWEFCFTSCLGNPDSVFFNHTAPILERFTCRPHPSPPRVQDNCECGRCGGWTKREVEMQSAFDWITIARPPQPRPRINRDATCECLRAVRMLWRGGVK